MAASDASDGVNLKLLTIALKKFTDMISTD